MAEEAAKLAYEASVERVSDIERKLAVEVAWDDVKGRLDEAYRELGKGVSVKGFRRGKVPRRMLEQLFGKHVNKEVTQHLVQDSIVQVMTEHELAPVSEPQIDEDGIEDGNAFKYSAVLQVVPDVEPKDYFGVEVKQRPPKVSDEDVERSLIGKQRELTKYLPVEGRATQAGDVLLVDVMGKVGDQPYDQENQLVELGGEAADHDHHHQHNEPLPGLADKLLGVEPGTDELDVELAVPLHDHGPDEPCPGDEKTQPARLLVSIKDIKQKVVPALDDELAKDSGEADTLEEFKQKLYDKLLEADEKRAREEAKRRLVDAILDKNDVPVVPALVDRQVDRMSQLQMMLMGMNPETPGFDAEPLKQALRPDAERQVRAGMLLSAISKKENVEVHDADIEKRLAELAAERELNINKLRAEYEEKGRIDQLKANLKEEKTLDLLMENATVVIAEIEEEGTEVTDASDTDADAASSPPERDSAEATESAPTE